MQQLVARLAVAGRIDRDRAERAARIVLGMLEREAPPEAVDRLFGAMEGAREAAGLDGEGSVSGGFGAMSAFNALTAAGLSVREAQAVTREIVAFAREKAGDAVVEQIVAAVPGLPSLS
jgi:hypothetical protein